MVTRYIIDMIFFSTSLNLLFCIKVIHASYHALHVKRALISLKNEILINLLKVIQCRFLELWTNRDIWHLVIVTCLFWMGVSSLIKSPLIRFKMCLQSTCFNRYSLISRSKLSALHQTLKIWKYCQRGDINFKEDLSIQ